MNPRQLFKRILIELVVTPLTVVLFALGMSGVLLSMVMGPMALFIGFCLLLLTLGACITNVIFNMESTMKKVIQDSMNRDKASQESDLDKLDELLVQDQDPRDQTALRNMRAIYSSFLDDVKENRLAYNVPAELLDQLKEMFESCLEQLRKQHQIWVMSSKLTGNLRAKMLSERDAIIKDVEDSVGAMASTIGDLRTLKLKNSTNELKRLRTKLTSQLNVAKAIEARMAELTQSDTEIVE